MIATLIILFSLLRDFRWPRKKPFDDEDDQDVVASVLVNKAKLLSPESSSSVARELCDCAAIKNGKMQNGAGAGGALDEEENAGSDSESPRGAKHLSEASSISTSVSTEQTQIDATLGSTSSGTLPSASSPLTPGSQVVANLQQQLSIQLQQHRNASSASTTTGTTDQTMTNSSTTSGTMNNSGNLRNRHEHRLLSNSSTDTISALYNLSSHSEGGYGGGNTVSGGTTTGSGHSGVITYPFKIRGDSTASTISTSACSEVLLPPDGGRRSSEGARLLGNRRSSGRMRRYVPRTTISSGGRRRTTGRYLSISFVWKRSGSAVVV